MEATGYGKAFVIAVIFHDDADARNDRERERGGEGEEARLRMITRESRDTIQEMHSVPRVDPSAAYEDSWPAHISIQIAIRAGPYLAATTALNRLPRSWSRPLLVEQPAPFLFSRSFSSKFSLVSGFSFFKYSIKFHFWMPIICVTRSK